jgi:hypothetical protein
MSVRVAPFAVAANPFGVPVPVSATVTATPSVPLNQSLMTKILSPPHWVVPWKDANMVEKIMVTISLPSGILEVNGLMDKIFPQVTNNGTELTVKIAWPNVLLDIEALYKPLLKNNILVGAEDFPLLRQKFTEVMDDYREDLGVTSAVTPFGIFTIPLGCEVDRKVATVPIINMKSHWLIVAFNLMKVTKKVVDDGRNFKISTIDSGSDCTPPVHAQKKKARPTVSTDTSIPSGIFTERTSHVNSQRSIRSVAPSGPSGVARLPGPRPEFGTNMMIADYSSTELDAAKGLASKRFEEACNDGQDDDFDSTDFGDTSPSRYFQCRTVS